MISGRLTQQYTKEKMKSYWAEWTTKLNSIPGGAVKEWTQWRKVNHTYTYFTKSKTYYSKFITSPMLSFLNVSLKKYL